MEVEAPQLRPAPLQSSCAAILPPCTQVEVEAPQELDLEPLRAKGGPQASTCWRLLLHVELCSTGHAACKWARSSAGTTWPAKTAAGYGMFSLGTLR